MIRKMAVMKMAEMAMVLITPLKGRRKLQTEITLNVIELHVCLLNARQ
jgi:hypothetical protein